MGHCSLIKEERFIRGPGWWRRSGPPRRMSPRYRPASLAIPDTI